MTARARLMLGLVAAVAWTGEIMFLAANARRFGSLAQSIWWTARFLTDWSGLLVAIVCTAAALGWRRLSSPFWTGLATVAIVLVGTMFGALGGWAGVGRRSFASASAASSLLAHVIAPWAMLLAWILVVRHGGLRWRDALGFTLWPVAYLTVTFGRGLSGGGYPYPQVDVDRLGWPPALAFSGGVLLSFLVLGALLVWVDRLLSRRRRVSPSEPGAAIRI